MREPGMQEEEMNQSLLTSATDAMLALVVDDADARDPRGLRGVVADSAVTEGPEHPSHIRRFEVDEAGRVRGGDIFVTTVGVPDGMRVDRDGNLWASAGPGVEVYTPEATLLGRIAFPADVTNLEFGAPDDGRLFVTAGGSLYLLEVLARGARWT